MLINILSGKRKPFSNKDLNINHSGLRGPSGEGRESLAL